VSFILSARHDVCFIMASFSEVMNDDETDGSMRDPVDDLLFLPLGAVVFNTRLYDSATKGCVESVRFVIHNES
jgi:hypothetical protein